jgi:hypothetical protein
MSKWKPPQHIRATAQAILQRRSQILVYEDQLSNGIWKEIDFLLHSGTRFFPNGMKDLVAKFCQ